MSTRARSVQSSQRQSSAKPNNPSRTQSRGGTATANPKQDGKMVGQYMLGKTVGEGTFGKVKIATHIPTGEKVAVKILEKSRIKDQADVRRVNREIKILKKVTQCKERPACIYLFSCRLNIQILFNCTK